MNKIAVIGVEASERKVLTQALSYLTGYDLVRPTAYSIKALKLSLKKDNRHSSWNELFTYAISSFSERIEIDQNFKQFISDGSVFDELAYLQTIYEMYLVNDQKHQEYADMNASLQKIVTDYAKRQYDCIVHIHNREAENDLFYKKLETILKTMTLQCKRHFYIKDEMLIGETLSELLADSNITLLFSSELALFKARQDINQAINS